MQNRKKKYKSGRNNQANGGDKCERDGRRGGEGGRRTRRGRGDEKRDRAIEHGNMLGFDSAFCTHPKSGRHISKYPAQGGIKGGIRRRWDPNAVFPRHRPGQPARTRDGYETGRKVARYSAGGSCGLAATFLICTPDFELGFITPIILC